MLKVISFSFFDKDHRAVAFEIRRTVFVDEQNVSREEEFDEFEETSRHYLVLLDEQSVGTARWRRTVKGIKLERFAVLKKYRNAGAGNVVFQKVLEDVTPLGETIYLHAQLPAVNFYRKAGFMAEGDLFTEAGIDHYLMVRRSN